MPQDSTSEHDRTDGSRETGREAFERGISGLTEGLSTLAKTVVTRGGQLGVGTVRLAMPVISLYAGPEPLRVATVKARASDGEGGTDDVSVTGEPIILLNQEEHQPSNSRNTTKHQRRNPYRPDPCRLGKTAN